jgi:hypothetical protein
MQIGAKRTHCVKLERSTTNAIMCDNPYRLIIVTV